jgi:hypothetical protein
LIAVLRTHPEQTEPTIHRLIETARLPLQDVDHDPPQIHAFNAIRAILNDAKLVYRSKLCVSSVVQLCITSFSSTNWRIRNCALMLFSTGIMRILGVKKGSTDELDTMSANEFYSKYPELHGFLKHNLAASVDMLRVGVLNEALYPLLLFISKLRLSLTHPEANEKLKEYAQDVAACACSRNAKVRLMAAQVQANLSTPVEEVFLVLHQLSYAKDLNTLHGMLCKLDYLLSVDFCTSVQFKGIFCVCGSSV